MTGNVNTLCSFRLTCTWYMISFTLSIWKRFISCLGDVEVNITHLKLSSHAINVSLFPWNGLPLPKNYLCLNKKRHKILYNCNFAMDSSYFCYAYNTSNSASPRVMNQLKKYPIIMNEYPWITCMFIDVYLS